VKRVLLIQVDGKLPNLALRKWGGFFKRRGYKVFYDECFVCPDIVKISCIFKWNAPKARGIAKLFLAMGCDVELGGVGINGKIRLPDEVEHGMPDYTGLDFSMGFTTRGCFRTCNFCDVWRYEGYIREHAPIDEFWHPAHNKIILFDNNFLGLPSYKDKLIFIRDYGLKLCLTQGYDARLITEEAASLIADIPHYNWKFTDKAIYTAWDRLQDEASVLKGIQNLINAGIKPRSIIPYILVGYNTSLEEDLYRFNKLRELGVYPFVMPYNNKPHPMRKWGQRPALFKSISFNKWHKNRKRSRKKGEASLIKGDFDSEISCVERV